MRDLLNAGANWRLDNAEGLTAYRLAERNRIEATAAHNTARAQEFQGSWMPLRTISHVVLQQ